MNSISLDIMSHIIELYVLTEAWKARLWVSIIENELDSTSRNEVEQIEQIVFDNDPFPNYKAAMNNR